MLETENGKMTTQEYKQPYMYIFKMTDKTGSSNRSLSRAHSHSHELIQPNNRYYLVPRRLSTDPKIDYLLLK